MLSWFTRLIAIITDTEDLMEETPPQHPDRAEASVLCPMCGMPVEFTQEFVRENPDGSTTEYATVRCLSDHYITVQLNDLDLLVVEAE